MIYIKDNFLHKKLLDSFNNDTKDFQEVKTPGKSFWVKELIPEVIDRMCDKLSIIEGCKIKNVLSFIREAKKGQDDDWRIHNDSIIDGTQPDRAIVLYLSEDDSDCLNGTAFWSHKEYGDVYTGTGAEEFNRMLKEDSNDSSKWDLKSIIGHKQNRLISYPCEYFHSKYPKEFLNSRRVLVMFYKTIKQ
jgi:hypothetical protein|tara:strand:+ start:79 stop:645 length:567 start_codon:yes stop_codon:yes gene_type:complete